MYQKTFKYIGFLNVFENVAPMNFFQLCTFFWYRVYQKKLNRFEIALNFEKQLLVSSFLCI
jgi:hypothetical protein